MKKYFVSYFHKHGFGNAFVENINIFNVNEQSRIIEKMNNYQLNTIVIINFIEMKGNEISGFALSVNDEVKE